MHSTHTVLSSLLGILLVSSTAVGAPILNGPSTGDRLSGVPTSQHARRQSTINVPGPYYARFGMPVAAAQNHDNAIHARVVDLSGKSGIAGSEVVTRGVVDEVSGLLDGREVATVSVPGSSNPSSKGSQHDAPIRLPGRIGLAGARNVNTRDLAIDVRDLGPMSTMSLIDVMTRSTSLPATESTQ